MTKKQSVMALLFCCVSNGLLLLDRVPHILAGLESGRALRGDLDLFASAGVAAFAGGLAADFKAAEAGDDDLSLFLQAFDDRVQRRVYRELSFLLGDIALRIYGFDEFLLIHTNTSM